MQMSTAIIEKLIFFNIWKTVHDYNHENGVYTYVSSFPFVRGEVLPATFSPPHLIVFSTLLCLLSSSSSLPPLLSSSHLSSHSPPISALTSLVSYCPAHVTLPLSSVVCHPPSFLRVQPTVICSSPVSMSNSSALPSLTILRLSALVTLAIFRTQLFSHTCTLCCCSSVSAKVSVPFRHARVTQVLIILPFSFLDPPVRHQSLNCSPRVRSSLYSSTYLSLRLPVSAHSPS